MHSCWIFPPEFNVPQIDIAFAISAEAFQSEANFKKMKDTVKEFIEKFGVHGKVHYSLLTFGDPPTVYLKFSDKSSSSSGLTALIDGVPKPSKGTALAKALNEAKMLFTPAAGSTANAKKILVVMIDKESDSSKEDAQKASRELDDEGIRVFAVALGDQDNLREVEAIVPTKENVIKPNDTDTPTDIANKIIDNMLNGKRLYYNSRIFLCLHIGSGFLANSVSLCFETILSTTFAAAAKVAVVGAFYSGRRKKGLVNPSP